MGARRHVQAPLASAEPPCLLPPSPTIASNPTNISISHLQGLFYRTVRMLEAGMKPVFVFDGKPPAMKREELSRRSDKRTDAGAGLEAAKEAGDADAVEKFAKRTVKVTAVHNAECKRLLTLMGVPVVDAPSEAEAQCAELVKHGLAYAIASEDMDSLTFGATRMVRNLMAPASAKLPVLEYDYDKARVWVGAGWWVAWRAEGWGCPPSTGAQPCRPHSPFLLLVAGPGRAGPDGRPICGRLHPVRLRLLRHDQGHRPHARAGPCPEARQPGGGAGGPGPGQACPAGSLPLPGGPPPVQRRGGWAGSCTRKQRLERPACVAALPPSSQTFSPTLRPPAEPETTPAADLAAGLKWSAPDIEGVVDFLVREKAFSEDRVRKALARVESSKSKASQGRLESFFGPSTVKSSSVGAKRKDEGKKGGAAKPGPKRGKAGGVGGGRK